MSKRFDKLNRQNMRALAPGKRIVEHGIVYEKLKNGDGRFELCIQVDGKRMHRVVGNESEGITRTHAEQAIEKLKHEARTNRLSLPKGRKLPMTFKDAAKKYLERSELEGGKNIIKKRQQIEQYLIPFFGDMPLAQISSFDTERFKKDCVDRKLSTSTVNRYLAVLSHLLSKAVEWDWLERAPIKIKKFKEAPGRISYLTAPQIQKLLDEAKKDDNLVIYPFIMIGLETAMRRMEILSIRIEHIDLNRRIIFIPEAKAGSREQPISSKLEAFLRDYLAHWVKPGQEWLFPSKTSKPGHVIAIEKPFRRAVEAAGLDSKVVVRHTLRHTAITHLVQAGVDLPTVKRISGHKTLQMVERYAHQNQDHIQAALSKLEDRYQES